MKQLKKILVLKDTKEKELGLQGFGGGKKPSQEPERETESLTKAQCADEDLFNVNAEEQLKAEQTTRRR